MFPFWALIPTGELGTVVRAQAWVPIDDHHTMYWGWQVVGTNVGRGGQTGTATNAGTGRPVNAAAPPNRAGFEYLPQTSGWLGRYNLDQNLGNDYLIDREAQAKGESFTGNLAWRHASAGDDVLISSPLGQGVARIVREHGEVTLTTAQREQYRAPDAESLTQKVLGFRLPLGGLADWVRARPSPDAPFRLEKSENGLPRVIEQRGWRIEYLEYENERPRLLRLAYPGIEMRLAISQWK